MSKAAHHHHIAHRHRKPYNGANLVGSMLGASGFGWLVQALGYRPAFVFASGVLALGSWAFWRQR